MSLLRCPHAHQVQCASIPERSPTAAELPAASRSVIISSSILMPRQRYDKLAKGAAGYVIDGAIRDAGAFAASDFPCYAKAAVHRGPYKNGPGEINVPVSIGGWVVNP